MSGGRRIFRGCCRLDALLFVIAVAWLPESGLIAAGRALEMEVTMVGLQNAGKTSLLRVLAVSFSRSDASIDALAN